MSGLPLYVNYGSVEDFQLLKNNGTDFKGKVCIARYGKVFRYFFIQLNREYILYLYLLYIV